MHATIARLWLLRGVAVAAVLTLSAACGGGAQIEQAGASPSATAASSGPADVLATYVDAYNADDLDGTMAVFTDDLLIGFLAASRRAEHSPDSEIHTSAFDTWRGPRIQAAGLITASVAAGFSVGFAIDQPVIGTLFGTLVGASLPQSS